ncbi:MAG: hypothetical protein ABEJ70_05070 [Halobacteriaceae archaeon]
MTRSLANVGNVNHNWKRYLALWLLLVLGIYLGTGYGLMRTFFVMAGVTLALAGVRSLWWSVTARSVEEVTVGSLGGRREAVELAGRARPVDDPLVAPLSGTECLAYTVEVTEYRPTGS